MNRISQKDKRYLSQRKICLKELMELNYKRVLLNKQIRSLQKEMAAWDRSLIL